jgi:hypothetical protein
MNELSDLFEFVYRVDLKTLALIIGEVGRIQRERLRAQGAKAEHY